MEKRLLFTNAASDSWTCARIHQHDIRQVRRGMRGVDRPVVAVLHQAGQVAAVVDVRVREDHRVQLPRLERQLAVALERLLAPSLVQPAFQQHLITVDAQHVGSRSPCVPPREIQSSSAHLYIQYSMFSLLSPNLFKIHRLHRFLFLKILRDREARFLPENGFLRLDFSFALLAPCRSIRLCIRPGQTSHRSQTIYIR